MELPQRLDAHPVGTQPTYTQGRGADVPSLPEPKQKGLEDQRQQGAVSTDTNGFNTLLSEPAKPLRGRVALVTGATSGIGLETAAALAHKGAKVVFGVRNPSKAEKVASVIRQRVPDADLLYPPAVPAVDFNNRASVAAFATALNARTDLPIHILVNNAGIADGSFNAKRNKEGIVDLVQVNYLGAYTLTRLLEGKLVACRARVVNVSSVTHRCFEVSEDPWQFLTNPRKGMYPHTKLANVLFTYELQRRLGSQGLQACAVDPGGVRTAIWKSVWLPGVQAVVDATYAPPEDAAMAVIHAATVPWEQERPEGAVCAADDLRLYARGLFTSPLITHLDGAWRTWSGSLLASLYGANVIAHSLLDWPIRWWSGGRYMSVTLLVPSARQTYDTKLAAALWEASEVAARLREPTTDTNKLKVINPAGDVVEAREVHDAASSWVKTEQQQQEGQQQQQQEVLPEPPGRFHSPERGAADSTASASKKRLVMSPGVPMPAPLNPPQFTLTPHSVERTGHAAARHAQRSGEGNTAAGDRAAGTPRAADASAAPPAEGLVSAGGVQMSPQLHLPLPPVRGPTGDTGTTITPPVAHTQQQQQVGVGVGALGGGDRLAVLEAAGEHASAWLRRVPNPKMPKAEDEAPMAPPQGISTTPTAASSSPTPPSRPPLPTPPAPLGPTFTEELAPAFKEGPQPKRAHVTPAAAAGGGGAAAAGPSAGAGPMGVGAAAAGMAVELPGGDEAGNGDEARKAKKGKKSRKGKK